MGITYYLRVAVYIKWFYILIHGKVMLGRPWWKNQYRRDNGRKAYVWKSQRGKVNIREI